TTCKYRSCNYRYTPEQQDPETQPSKQARTVIIAHDLGTTGNKASLHHDDGRLVASTTVGYPAHFAAGGVAEQNPQDWWDAVVSATRDLLQRTETHAADVQGL